MNFSEKLKYLRKSKGFTQEKLADALNVSRQAVTKWESGLAYPDIENLIQISNYMHVTVDYLVRDQEYRGKAIKTTIKELDELLHFKLKANQNTNAAFMNEIQSTRLGAHDYRYEEGQYVYYDSYLGNEHFAGEEAIWRKGQAVYAMNYMGQVIKDSFSINFLKEALQKAGPEMPYRGPELYQSGKYTYRCKANGNLTWFQGYEEIFRNNEKIYECHFHGGLLH